MIRPITILFLIPVLAGCTLNKEVRIEYRDVNKPVLVCPAPNINPPSPLPIETLSAEDRLDYGKVARSYKASLVILKGDNDLLRAELDKYLKTSEQYEKIKQEVEQKFVK